MRALLVALLAIEAWLVMVVVWRVLPFVLVKSVGWLIFQKGDWARAKLWLGRVRFLLPPASVDSLGLAIAEFSGDTAVALEMAESLLTVSPHSAFVNQSVTSLINGGRYRRAVDAAAPCERPTKNRDLRFWGLLQTNVAEAEYNLGRWEDALARLERMPEGWKPRDIERAGGYQQKAWVLAHLGRASEARAAMRAVALRDLPRIFHSEYHFTLAQVALAEGDTLAALQDVEKGLALARRVASTRNGLFIRARILALRGKTDRALADFEKAAASPYRGQGGDGLLAWGDLLRSLGREKEARHAFALAQERDPESESAAIAARRLAQVA